ncbi:MAG: murein L,D-transpeptidase family protein [Saprospiraceae bacterium]
MKKRKKKAILFLVIVLLSIIYFLSKKENLNLDHINLENWKETPASTFRKDQIRFERVRDAYEAKEIYIKKLLTFKGFNSFHYNLFLRAFKHEEILEVWIRRKKSYDYQLLTTYDFCKNSGQLGPKRMEGDYQIPEGFYRISHFNPKSNFLLSLKVNYPNDSDKILSDPTSPGSDIYVHGGCQTTGCIPLTNDKIQELYLLAIEAKEEGRNIPIHIFPTKKFEDILDKDSEHFSFWENLKEGFDSFEENKRLPFIEVNADGNYHIRKRN